MKLNLLKLLSILELLRHTLGQKKLQIVDNLALSYDVLIAML